MPLKKSSDIGQLDLLEARTSTAPCVPAIRLAVQAWKEGGYKGVTTTTRALLNFWFIAEHLLPNRKKFAYHYAQRDAIETLIYLYEVANIRNQADLLTKFTTQQGLRLLQNDSFGRYCIKMATGSGKTKVMALAIAWQYFNAVLENDKDYAKTFLVIAPNVIVFERLKSDFNNGNIFRKDPVIPPELQIFWEFDCYVRGDGERASTDGSLYLTNIQQFYERKASDDGEADEMTAILGPRPPTKKIEIEDFDLRIAARKSPCMVLNDEAHHTHDEKSEWNEVIRRVAASLEPNKLIQLDVTATPRHTKGQLFTWTVFDYPLKQAIIDNIVKRPMKGLATGIKEAPSDIASQRYEAYLVAGVERWREYRDQLALLNKKPLLFVMMNDTKEADDVGDFLQRKYPADFAGEQLLVIHTDRSGEVSKADLDKARDTARQVDSATSPVNAIVSVLMLREGWDVQNVTVIVGLRPYSSKANILPEQTIGRGLRLMFRDQGLDTYTERVDVIGNKNFIEFVEQLEKEEDIKLDTFNVGQDKLVIVTIAPDTAKLDKDIALPILSPILVRKKTLAEEIAGLDIGQLQHPILPMKQGDHAEQVFKYEGYDIITLQKVIEREYQVPEPRTPEEVISYYAKRIAQDVKLPSQFAALVPKVTEFLETKAFGQAVELHERPMIKAISSNVACYVTIKTFAQALRSLVIEERTPELVHEGHRLSETVPFPYSRPTLENADKCIFNLTPCDNEFEKKFAKFLQEAEDVERFCSLPRQFGFSIEYTDSSANLRYYEPDFVVVLQDQTHWIIETKGQINIEVAHKNHAATLWCENATLLTDIQWKYAIIHQKEYESLQPDCFSDLFALTLDL